MERVAKKGFRGRRQLQRQIQIYGTGEGRDCHSIIADYISRLHAMKFDS